MSVIYILITVSLIVAVIFFVAFVMAVRGGQYDDSYTPGVRMLFEDELIPDERDTKQSDPSNNNQ
ncbi:cbb3-type cytochrome oxidase assembly protein CcoS [Robertkochia sediminum]|uniref:cbb3-type cytochrome oxidase assembly protein CcoS n=1 Tax=Robertkochia sediminum TaxID=2785326 RepID=UPI0019311EDA|nr:cbb3-type cytochrome oxidase assembly protein CcoS [Robertkochia sediminum]MBL7471297.1 cbb3-type cytochrome oxidase assembly protein CcoS [Robertkochia sediminum]